MSTRKPLQDISNKVFYLQPKEPQTPTQGTKPSITSTVKKSTMKEEVPFDEDMRPSPTTFGEIQSDFEEIADLKEFYEVFSHEINEKVCKSLEREKLRNQKLELQCEQTRKQVAQLLEDNRTLSEQLKQTLKTPKKDEVAELKTHIRELTEKLIKKDKKLHSEVEQKEKLTTQLKSKDITNIKLRETNERLSKFASTEDKLSKKAQDQLKIKDEKIELLQKDVERERKMKAESDARSKVLEDLVEELKGKIASTVEEIQTSNKLIEVLDAKLKISNDRCKDMEDKFKRGEEKREEESSELLTLREEITNICDALLKEKQEKEKHIVESEQVIRQKEKLESEVSKKQSELDSKIEENSDLRSTIEKLERQIEKLVQDIDQSARDLEEIDHNYGSRMAELETCLSKKDQELEEMKQKEEKTMDQLKELDIFVEKTTKKIEREKVKTREAEERQKEAEDRRREAEERARMESENYAQLSTRNSSLMKKIDSISRANYEMVEENKEKEGLLVRFKNYTEELEGTLAKKEEELDSAQKTIKSTLEEVQKERAKSERSWKELEETLKMVSQMQAEKEVAEKKSSHTIEVLEMKMNNKISMLEKKCEYLKKLNDMSKEGGEGQIKEMEEYINKLSRENERSSDKCVQFEITLSSKDMEIACQAEKIRQLEDLLHSQAQMQSMALKPNDLKKRLLSVEKALDDILIQLSIEGITISEMSPREKALMILDKFNEVRKEVLTLVSEKEQHHAEVQRMKSAKETYEQELIMLKDAVTKEAVRNDEECLNDLKESCDVLYTKINKILEERTFSEDKKSDSSLSDSQVLDDLLEGVVSIQINMKKVNYHLNQVEALQKVIETQEVFNNDYVGLCSELESRVRFLMEERDTLLNAQLVQKQVSAANRKKLEKILIKTVSTQTTEKVTEKNCEGVNTGTQTIMVEEEPVKEFNPETSVEYASLKQKYQKLLYTCHKYKKLMLKFTELHTKEKSKMSNSIEEHDLAQLTHDNDLEEPQQDIPLVSASLQKPIRSVSPSPKSFKTPIQDENVLRSPTNSVSSIRSVSTTLSTMSERSTISLKNKARPSSIGRSNGSNSYLTGHIMNRNKLK